MVDFQSIQYVTAKTLRDNEDLRTVDKREEVWELVKLSIPIAKFYSRTLHKTDPKYMEALSAKR